MTSVRNSLDDPPISEVLRTAVADTPDGILFHGLEQALGHEQVELFELLAVVVQVIPGVERVID